MIPCFYALNSTPLICSFQLHSKSQAVGSLLSLFLSTFTIEWLQEIDIVIKGWCSSPDFDQRYLLTEQFVATYGKLTYLERRQDTSKIKTYINCSFAVTYFLCSAFRTVFNEICHVIKFQYHCNNGRF